MGVRTCERYSDGPGGISAQTYFAVASAATNSSVRSKACA